MRLVWLDVPGGGEIPVNPDQVAYLRMGQGEHGGKTEVVFGAVNGGLHSVIVAGDGYDVAGKLQGYQSECCELTPPDNGIWCRDCPGHLIRISAQDREHQVHRRPGPEPDAPSHPPSVRRCGQCGEVFNPWNPTELERHRQSKCCIGPLPTPSPAAPARPRSGKRRTPKA
jgi:hypothetical protein